MAAPVIQFKRGLLENLPGLRVGEPAFTTDTYDLFVGLTSEISTNKFFGSHRYWTKETTATGSGINLVEATLNGSNFITLASPALVGAAITYYFPATQGSANSVLTNDGDGNLIWGSGSSDAIFSGITTVNGTLFDVNADADFSGITTFSNTQDNVLGNPDTGAVQIDGGLGVNKNVTVGAGLSVTGVSHFIGTVTFYGGQINLGDSDTDDIVVAGEFKSNLIPSDDATYNIGNSSKRWNNANFAGVGTFSSGSVINQVRIGISGSSEIDTISGNLTLDSAGGNVNIDDNLNVSGISTFTGNIDADGDLNVDGHTELDDVNVSGVATISNLDVQTGFDVYANDSTFHQNVIIQGNLTVNGEEVILNVSEKIIEDKHLVLGFTTTGNADDITANGGGIAIASTEGNPLVNLQITGINTEPNTYKQLIWTSAGTFGAGTTDAFLFNYAVGIGSTQVPNGVRLAVGGVHITDDTVIAENLNVSGIATITSLDITLASIDQLSIDDLNVTGITTLSTVGTGQLTSSDINVSGVVTATQFNGDVNSSAITATNLNVSGDLYANNGIGVTGQVTFHNDLLVSGISTFNSTVNITNGVAISGQTTLNNDLLVSGISTFTGTLNSTSQISGSNLNISGITTTNDLNVFGNTSIGDTSGDTLTVNSTTTFNGNVSFSGPVEGTIAGTISTASRAIAVDTTETTTNAEYYPIFVSNSSTSQAQNLRTDSGITYNPSTDSLTVPNLKTENIKHSNGTQSIAIDSIGNVGVSSNLTINGNLFVNGNTTTVNTQTVKVKDSLIDIGKIDDGSGNLIPPTSDLNIDVGILFNYFQTQARKAAVYWDDSESRIVVASNVTETNSVLTANAYAALEVGGLWVNNACSGGPTEVISCFSGSQLEIRNVLIDAGTF
jgi:hypothetical protein